MDFQTTIDSVLRTTESFNCGSSLITLLPSFLFLFYSWCLSHMYIQIYMNPISRHHRNMQNNNRWWQHLLKNTLTLILVWSIGQFWTDGILRFLKTYILVFFLTINNCLENKYKLNHTTIITLEYFTIMIICYSLVVFMRWCCICVSNNYTHRTILRSRRQLIHIHDWPMDALRMNDVDELGENGYLLMQNVLPPELNHTIQYNMDNNDDNNAIQLKQTQSCPLFEKKMKNALIITKRRKSL